TDWPYQRTKPEYCQRRRRTGHGGPRSGQEPGRHPRPVVPDLSRCQPDQRLQPGTGTTGGKPQQPAAEIPSVIVPPRIKKWPPVQAAIFFQDRLLKAFFITPGLTIAQNRVCNLS